MSKRAKKSMKRAGAKAPAWLREIAASKATAKAAKRHKAKRLGTFGPASAVRHISPTEGAAA